MTSEAKHRRDPAERAALALARLRRWAGAEMAATYMELALNQPDPLGTRIGRATTRELDQAMEQLRVTNAKLEAADEGPGNEDEGAAETLAKLAGPYTEWAEAAGIRVGQPSRCDPVISALATAITTGNALSWLWGAAGEAVLEGALEPVDELGYRRVARELLERLTGQRQDLRAVIRQAEDEPTTRELAIRAQEALYIVERTESAIRNE